MEVPVVPRQRTEGVGRRAGATGCRYSGGSVGRAGGEVGARRAAPAGSVVRAH